MVKEPDNPIKGKQGSPQAIRSSGGPVLQYEVPRDRTSRSEADSSTEAFKIEAHRLELRLSSPVHIRNTQKCHFFFIPKISKIHIH